MDRSGLLGSKGWRSGESTRLPQMWPRFKSLHRRHMWVEFVVGSLLCSERFFSEYSGFSLSSKTNISKFQFDQESGRQRTTLWMCYLQIIIYLFVIYLSNESLLLVVVVAQVFKKPHVEKGEGSNKENEVDNSKLNPTGE